MCIIPSRTYKAMINPSIINIMELNKQSALIENINKILLKYVRVFIMHSAQLFYYNTYC